MPELEQLPSMAPRPETNEPKLDTGRTVVAVYVSRSMIDPAVYALFPKCGRPGCNRPLTGQVVLLTGELMHARCVPQGTNVLGGSE